MGNNTNRNAAQLSAKPWSREWGEMPKHYYAIVDTTAGQVIHTKIPSAMSANSLAQHNRADYHVYFNEEDVTSQLAEEFGY